MRPLITCKNLTYIPPLERFSGKSYDQGLPPQPPILRSVSLTIAEGEFLAIIGANGSGKTTLARHFNALLTPSRGEVYVDEMDTRKRENLPAIRRLVGMVLQSPEDQMVAERVEAEVAFGVENLGLAAHEMNERIDEALHVVGMDAFRQHPTFTLSAGQMQRVAIAGVLAMRPWAIVFDESTALLDPQGRNALMSIMQRLHAEGITIVLITHFMEEAAQAGRIVVLEAGEIVMDGTPEQVFSDEAALKTCHLSLPPAGLLGNAIRTYLPQLPAQLITLEGLVDSLTPHLQAKNPSIVIPDAPISVGNGTTGDWIIDAQHLGHTYLKDTPLAYRALDDVSLCVRRGSIYGLAGATGSGKSTLLQHFNGLIPTQEGSLQVAGYDLRDIHTDLKTLRRQVGMAFQLPEMYFFEQYVGDEVAYGLKMMGVSERPDLRARVKFGMESAGLDFDAFVDRLTFTLSSGEKRRVALACVLALEPQLLLLDEPTAGLDPAAHAELLRKLEALHSQGVTILLSSHQIEDLATLADAVCILSGGRVLLTGTTRSVLTQSQELCEAGLQMPTAAQAAQKLRERGINLPAEIITNDGFVDAVRSLLGV